VGTLRLATLVALSACTGRPAEPARSPIVLVDDAGDTVRLAAPARRLVSLNPVVTELVFALGAGRRLAGRTSECDYPPAAAWVPSVGGWLPPNVEAVVARTPDLVVVYRSPSTAAAVTRLRALRIPTIALRTDRLADVSRLTRLLGPALDARRSADSLASAYDGALAARRAAVTRPPAQSVVLVAWDSPLIVLGAGSYVSEMVELAGAGNVFADISRSSAPTSLEAVAAHSPRAVLVVGGSDGFVARPEWRTLAAVRERRVLRLDDPALARPSPRAPGAISALRRRLDSALRTAPAREISR
jgi:iron complex transport system substrate-binding protein